MEAPVIDEEATEPTEINIDDFLVKEPSVQSHQKFDVKTDHTQATSDDDVACVRTGDDIRHRALSMDEPCKLESLILVPAISMVQPTSSMSQGKIKRPRKGGIPGLRQHRISKEQKDFLDAEFKLDANWTPEKVTELATRMDLKRTKIYKWFYDRRNRVMKRGSAQSTH